MTQKALIIFRMHKLYARSSIRTQWTKYQQPYLANKWVHTLKVTSLHPCRKRRLKWQFDPWTMALWIWLGLGLQPNSHPNVLSSNSSTKQNRSTEGCSKLKRSVDKTSSGKNGLNIRTNASPKWAGPGVRRSKRPLLASRTRCNVLWKPPKFGNKVKIGIKVQFGNKFANRCNVWSMRVSLYMVMSQNVM